jgi:spore coat protein U-like protein
VTQHLRSGSLSIGSSQWRTVRRAVVGFALLTFATLAGALQCTVGTTSVAFGTYEPFSNAPNESTGTVTVSCDASAPYSVSINPGGIGSFNRALTSGAYHLVYNLYTDSARTVIWGDGTGSTARVNATGTGATYIVYGRIPAHQNVHAGAYADTLIVTVDF